MILRESERPANHLTRARKQREGLRLLYCTPTNCTMIQRATGLSTITREIYSSRATDSTRRGKGPNDPVRLSTRATQKDHAIRYGHKGGESLLLNDATNLRRYTRVPFRLDCCAMSCLFSDTTKISQREARLQQKYIAILLAVVRITFRSKGGVGGSLSTAEKRRGGNKGHGKSRLGIGLRGDFR